MCRQAFKDAFDIEGDDDFLHYQSVDSEGMAVEDIDKTNLLLDMKKAPDSDWNAAVLHILTKRVERAYRHAGLPQRPHEYFQDVVRGKFDRARARWRQTQKRVTEKQILETTDEVSTRVAESKSRELAAARGRERKASVGAHLHVNTAANRVQKFKRRMDTVSSTVLTKQQETAADTHVWEYLQSMFTALGKEGMSSDESDYDQSIGTYYRPKSVPWRRNIIRELDMVDKEHRRLGNTERRRGAKPVIRRRDGQNAVSSSDPVPGLPISLYSPDWLKEKSAKYVKHSLKPMISGFQWKSIGINNAY
jgi:hypothetical protein